MFEFNSEFAFLLALPFFTADNVAKDPRDGRLSRRGGTGTSSSQQPLHQEIGFKMCAIITTKIRT